MRFTYLVIVCLAVLFSTTLAKSHRKKHHKESVEQHKPIDELDMLAEDAAAEEEKKENPIENVIEESEKVLPEETGLWYERESTGKASTHPCAKKHCGPGKECKVVEGEATCDCVKECPEEVDDRRKVCSNHNETWNSDCAVYRMRCLCTEKSDLCTDAKFKHVHIDYFGVCRELEECAESEMEDFPRRMREWLFNVLQDLARKQEMEDILVRLEKDAKENQSRKWVNAVIWKFCDLDNHPHDRSVSRHELFPLRAPLIAMEHCISPFLDTCDANDDHIISLVEWGKCLGLEENEIEDKCAFLRKSMQKE